MIQNPESTVKHPGLFKKCVEEMKALYEHPTEFDFIVFFTLRMLETMSGSEDLILNRSNGYL